VVQLFAVLDVSPEAASGGMVATLAALIGLVVKVATWMVERKRKAAMADVGPVAPQPIPLPQHHVQLPPELVDRMSRMENAVTAWSLDTCRAEVKSLQAQLRQLETDQSIRAQRIIELSLKLDVCEQQNTKLQERLREVKRERDRALARLDAIERSDTDPPPPDKR
jgi:septal ring factor EnvC (AmiA/AmiB activator)